MRPSFSPAWRQRDVPAMPRMLDTAQRPHCPHLWDCVNTSQRYVLRLHPTSPSDILEDSRAL